MIIFELSYANMSINLKNISKKYGSQLVLDDVSFEVRKGEILGFIGPNGAGKSTTMKIITGYIPPTKGEVIINGMDAVEHSLKIRKIIGYLPEANPLYTDMYVKEYLRYIAGIYGLRKNASKLVSDIIERTGLAPECHKQIRALSNGYRQRVGLADSLVHDPELLILDEPTVGLDPYQIRQVRELIKQLAEKHTILLSTHILPEVEAICERILIINEGKIVAADTEENLHKKLHACSIVEMEIQADKAEAIAKTNNISGVDVRSCEELSDGWLWVEVEADSPSLRVELFNLAVVEGWALRELTEQEHSLEDTFVQITRNARATS
jgi:ABC-2 type transport system ATP-binding protein